MEYYNRYNTGDYVISLYGLMVYHDSNSGLKSLDLRQIQFCDATGGGSEELKNQFPFAVDESRLRRCPLLYKEYSELDLKSFLEKQRARRIRLEEEEDCLLLRDAMEQ